MKRSGRGRARRVGGSALLNGLFAAVLLIPLACATGGGGEDPEIEALLHVPDTVFVVVTNRNWLNVNVHAFYGASRYRLGTVVTNNTAEFVVPGGLAESNRFFLTATPIGADDVYATDDLQVRKGNTVELMVMTPLAQSYYAIRVGDARGF